MPDESSLGVWLFSASVDDSSPGGWVSGSIQQSRRQVTPGNAGGWGWCAALSSLCTGRLDSLSSASPLTFGSAVAELIYKSFKGELINFCFLEILN